MAGVNWEWLLVAKGLRVSCRAQLPTPGFHGYLRTIILGSEAGAAAPEAGLGDRGGGLFIGGAGQGLGCFASPTAPYDWARGLRKGMASSAGENVARGRARGARGAAGREMRGENALWLHSLNSSPTSLPPRHPKRQGVQYPIGRSRERQESRRGATSEAHTLCPQGSWPCQTTASLLCCPGCRGAEGLGAVL